MFTHFGKILEKSIERFFVKSQKPKKHVYLREKMSYLRAFYEKTAAYFFIKFCQIVKAICLHILSNFKKNCRHRLCAKCQKPCFFAVFLEKRAVLEKLGQKNKKAAV